MSIGWVDAPVTDSGSNASVATNEGILNLDDAVVRIHAAVVGGGSATWHWSWVTPDFSGEPPVDYVSNKLRIECSSFGAPTGVLTITADGHGETLTLSLSPGGEGIYGEAAYSTDANDADAAPYLPGIVAPFLTHLADGLAIDEASVYARPLMGTGHSRLRRVYTVPERSVDIAWLLTDAQMAAADDWFENALQAGSLAFAVPVKSQDSAAIAVDAVQWWTAKWAAPPRCEPRRGGLWHYSGRLRLFGEASDTLADPLPLGAACTVALQGSAGLTVSQQISASFNVELSEQLSLGLVNFGLALT